MKHYMSQAPGWPEVAIWLHSGQLDMKRNVVSRNLIWMEVNFSALLPFLLLLTSTADLIAGVRKPSCTMDWQPWKWQLCASGSRKERCGACHLFTLWSPHTILDRLLSGFLYMGGRELAPAVFIQLFYATKTNCYEYSKENNTQQYTISLFPTFCTPAQNDFVISWLWCHTSRIFVCFSSTF